MDDGAAMQLPGLQIVTELARGGMGVVYRAIEAEAGRDVAVKMMQPFLSCLSGSEFGGAGDLRGGEFLSCLSGSEYV